MIFLDFLQTAPTFVTFPFDSNCSRQPFQFPSVVDDTQARLTVVVNLGLWIWWRRPVGFKGSMTGYQMLPDWGKNMDQPSYGVMA